MFCAGWQADRFVEDLLRRHVNHDSYTVVLGICQRDTANFYEFLPELADDFRDLIVRFYHLKISGKFPDPSCKLQVFDIVSAQPLLMTLIKILVVFDVYINKGNRRVWLLDINPFGPMTDALLYKWEDILTGLVAGQVVITMQCSR